MALPGGQLRGRLLKRFNELGPYLRENQCGAENFFFDCLAVCVNVKPAPEKREFWGWWLTLEAQDDHFTYQYAYGLFDKEGDWQETVIKKAEDKEGVEQTLQKFFPRLEALLTQLNIQLIPAAGAEKFVQQSK
ncbi:sigma factor-binding protein Crl [Tatumella citrea]|uniref:Sigma factor-binding protein Crl n=1 Tax=Tatumella citrea TaxID=53336 RepID=A0A1Y0LF25_TATCI|nr:sigma factor-binding protein Crl [Tatumella citrea]ARU96240.1 sigma factor-binding protein Crl [Tatumella citrea]ARV00276.1 sigma factor-binding protein Crl [Tatumella citrea]